MENEDLAKSQHDELYNLLEKEGIFEITDLKILDSKMSEFKKYCLEIVKSNVEDETYLFDIQYKYIGTSILFFENQVIYSDLCSLYDDVNNHIGDFEFYRSN